MVEILHYEKANKNKTIGYVDILVPVTRPTAFIFRRIAHVQSGDRRWFSLSSFARDKADGTQEYLKHAQFQTEAYNTQMLDGIADKVKQFCESHGVQELPHMDFETFPKDQEVPF